MAAMRVADRGYLHVLVQQMTADYQRQLITDEPRHVISR